MFFIHDYYCDGWHIYYHLNRDDLGNLGFFKTQLLHVPVFLKARVKTGFVLKHRKGKEK